MAKLTELTRSPSIPDEEIDRHLDAILRALRGAIEEVLRAAHAEIARCHERLEIDEGAEQTVEPEQEKTNGLEHTHNRTN